MARPRLIGATAIAIAVTVSSCVISLTTPGDTAAESVQAPRDDLHEQRVMQSAFCAGCHPAIYAEHSQNTHGRAFTDEEVRLATGRFDHSDCIRCHTPRPVFETGIGMNPMRRHHGLEEGNTCMTCHWTPDYDYGSFHGGAQCKDAFDPRVGQVDACASCHRNHGTPYQWELAPTGKQSDRSCMTCHMPLVTRPVAVGQPPTKVRSHEFPGCRSETQLRRAYRYGARIDGNEVVVTVKNKGAGHNFPTELKQRSVESLIVVRDRLGEEVARSRMVFRDPYKRPYGLTLPVNTQIPAGETREHRVPLTVADGTVDTELHFKLYYPIEDHHPDLARRLEARRLVFSDITPSEEQVIEEPAVQVVVPESIPVEIASPANLVDYARPPIGTVELDIPEGDGPDDIRRLIELFQFPVPEGSRLARERLAAIGGPAIPALVEAMGSWDNKTWKQAMKVLGMIGAPARPAVIDALRSDQLYVRLHARELIPEMSWGDDRASMLAAMREGLSSTHPLDRSGAAIALGLLHDRSAADTLRSLLGDSDPDVVRAAALALGQLGDVAAVEGIERAIPRMLYDEIRRDLAEAAAMLGSTTGIPILLDGLDHRDDLIREDFFESLFAVTGVHLGYDPMMPRDERLEAISRLKGWWAADGNPDALRRPPRPDPQTHARAWHLVQNLGGQRDGGEKDALVAMGDDAVPALVIGLKYPAGFDTKRALICECLGIIASPEAAPALSAALRDPVLAVTAWACWALERIRDPATSDAVRRYQDRLLSLASAGRIPAQVGPVDRLLMQAARTQLFLGERSASQDLIPLLLSDDEYTRRMTIDALQTEFGETKGYDPDGDEDERRRAAARWSQ